MRDPVRIFMFLWLLGLTIYVGLGTRGDTSQLAEVDRRLASLEETSAVRASMSGLNQTPPRSGSFKILHAPNGKWRLFRSGVWIADFETLAAAELGMNLCINPEVQHYNEAGQLISG